MGKRLKNFCKSASAVRHRKRRIMNHPFQILAGFLDRYADEVEGRSMEELTPEIKAQLQQFASGALADSERRRVIGLLKDNPQWLALLAAEVKVHRGDKS
jgi:hypothetical protein